MVSVVISWLCNIFLQDGSIAIVSEICVATDGLAGRCDLVIGTPEFMVDGDTVVGIAIAEVSVADLKIRKTAKRRGMVRILFGNFEPSY